MVPYIAIIVTTEVTVLGAVIIECLVYLAHRHYQQKIYATAILRNVDSSHTYFQKLAVTDS